MNPAHLLHLARAQARRALASRRLRDTAKVLVLAPLLATGLNAAATTSLADTPIFATNSVPGNVALALSVEWPTASRAAYPGTANYSTANTYKGYFDPEKCYVYNYVAVETATSVRHFAPNGASTGHVCTGTDQWSGNFLNWASTQAIDPFRSVMTGGNRLVDTTTTTILQKAWHSGQGNLFQNKSISTTATVEGATPFSRGGMSTRIDGAGFRMLYARNLDQLNGDNAVPAAIPYVSGALLDGVVYEVFMRIKVCDPASGTGGVEANCRQYGSNWKPEGLMQQYSQRLRFSAFGYLNESGNQRDGGVMRARMKFVGPTRPVPGQPATTNAAAEWDATTGVFVGNPDSTDAGATNTTFAPSVSITNSGVANYLNKFGQLSTGDYKGNDPVGELYYATIRYYKNLGNVPEWTNMGTASAATISTRLDGFPVITPWDDPIQYSCQKNFVLGIGDIYTHGDKGLPGATNRTDEPTGGLPSAISSDTSVSAVDAANRLGVLQGLGTSYGTRTNISNGCCSNNSGMMAGLAYHSNVNDIRPDTVGQPQTTGRQTVQTLWVDVLEQAFQANNQFYLTAKFGGFTPAGGMATYDYANTTALTQSWWSTSGETLTDTRPDPDTTQPRPDNYFTAGNPDQMITGLTRAFERINTLSAAFTTSFSTSLPQVAQLDNASFGAQYDPSTWTGEVVASELDFSTDGVPTLTERWRATSRLATQLAGTGWDTARRVVTWSGTAGVAFRSTSIAAGQLTALDTSYRTGNDSADYLNYLRGDRTHEQNSTATGSSRAYRTRAQLLGDIVGSRARPIGPPALPLSDASNPGYSAFKTARVGRPTVLYVGANDGMLHAFNGALSGTGSGQEIFAYVPSATFSGPSSPTTPNVNGLASLGNPSFAHHYLVNATPTGYDVDFTRTWTGTAVGTGTADWRTVLIGGLGKGGRSYYAIDVTDPGSITTEAIAAGRVLWEFTAPTMGYTFGEPVVVKTRKYGWTVIIPSGYNSSDGRGYLYFVNPRTGALLETVTTGVGSTTNDAGLAHVNGYVVDFTDGYADAIYGGDLLGNLWRFDITATSGAYPSPIVLARLTDSSGNAQPITSRPMMELHPRTKKRVVLVGTGRLLDESDISSTREQTFYAIEDGNQLRFNAAVNLPGGVDFPIERNELIANPNLLTGFTGTTTSMGWYHELGRDTATNVGWRVVSDPATFSGTVAFAPTLPSISDPCAPSGSSRIYATDYASGISRLINDSGVVSFMTMGSAGVVTDLRFLSVGGRVRLIGGTDRGAVERIRGNFGSTIGLRRLNWRELQIGN
ncbi:PilC/PilY family type IV pilus protein [uncultured Methylibium sp.]|uniref:pilus assembly protein n=1 Tax=uncultured Methylibium sp. TaxID=381093 RepID=UPI0025CB82C1|nr:PilC/PilY family type IV pilus protein [uncultured Methylibium sp.]